MRQESLISHVSDTAFWVATHRTTETKRNDALFKDPLAEVLTGDRGKKIAHSMRKVSKYSFWTLSIRTALIDELIRTYIKNGGQHIINLGAGLDTRPYRLELNKNIHWYEIDFPHVIQYKNDTLNSYTPTCFLTRLSTDLSNDSERKTIFNTINSQVEKALVLTEGVVPYLSEGQVTELAKNLLQLSNLKFWATEFYSPKLYPRFQAPSFQKQLGSAPFQFYPKDYLEFYESTGWHKKELHYLYDLGNKVGRPFPYPWWVQLIKQIKGNDFIEKNARLMGYALLEK